MSFSPYKHIDEHLNSGGASKNTDAYTVQSNVMRNRCETSDEIVDRIANEPDPRTVSKEATGQMIVYMLGEIASQLQKLNNRMDSIEAVTLSIEKTVWEIEHLSDEEIPNETPAPLSWEGFKKEMDGNFID